MAVAARNFDYRGPLPDDLNCNVTAAGNQADSATMGASMHYAKDFENFGRKSDGKVRFGFFRQENSGSFFSAILFRLLKQVPIIELVICWKVAHWNAKTLLPKFLDIFIRRSRKIT